MSNEVSAKLMIHTRDGFYCDEDTVAGVPVPKSTKTFCPIPHIEFLNLVRESLPKYGIGITKQEFGLAKDGQRFFSVLTGEAQTQDFAVAIGLRGSYDKTIPAIIGLGHRVFVCDNIAFSAEYQIRRKHTSRIMNDLPGLIDGTLRKMPAARFQLEAEVEAMKAFVIDNRTAHDTMIEAVKRNIFPGSKIKKVAQIWENPLHEAFQPRNAWSLLNTFTEVNKERKHTVAGHFTDYQIHPFIVNRFQHELTPFITNYLAEHQLQEVNAS